MAVEDHLTTKARVADFAVDMSNVIKEQRLCGERKADLRRFIRLIDGLIAYTKDRSVQVYGVADGSLLSNPWLNRGERERLERWSRRGLIEVLDVADDRILELADGTGVSVVCLDNYKDYYRSYPWIPGNRDRFFQPVPAPGGRVAVLPKVMPVPEESEISRKEEEGILLRRGLYDRRNRSGVRHDLLTRLWRCPVDDCPMFGPQRAAEQPLPDNRSGAVRCPTHRRPLADLGPNPRRVQVKVRIGGDIGTRFVVAAGQEIAVGRAPGDAGFALLPWLQEIDDPGISRRHVILRWDGKVLRVVDTSRNGTSIRRRAKSARKTKETTLIPLTSGRPFTMRRGDVIVLGEGVELLVSGREYVFDEAPEPAVPEDEIVREASRRTGMRHGGD